MKRNEYSALIKRLNSLDDIEKISRAESLDPVLLTIIYTQKITRHVIKNFYKVKGMARKYCYEWRRGARLIDLSKRVNFPPVLFAYIIFMENKVHRKVFWEYIRKPENIRDRKLRAEIIEIVKNDIIYSPSAIKKQYERGKKGEENINNWLTDKKIPFLTEAELRSTHAKTPDFLLLEPIEIKRKKIKWIESKATFGDLYEIRRNMRKQILPYIEIFGSGAVVYWFGYIEDIIFPKDLVILDGNYF